MYMRSRWISVCHLADIGRDGLGLGRYELFLGRVFRVMRGSGLEDNASLHR